jgi:predicted nucleic acid-binding protein
LILLDTGVPIEIFDKHFEKGRRLLSRVVERGDRVGTTSINLHEILYGHVCDEDAAGRRIQTIFAVVLID